jgi:hypothetical protein
MTIVSNGQPRNIIDAYELSEEERKEFNYINWGEVSRGMDGASFFRYKGELYDLNQFERSIETFKDWDLFQSDTFFSGILVRYCNDFEQVIVGRFYA